MSEAYELEDTGAVLDAAMTETDLPGLHRCARGKVRDIYDLGDRLLIVATDRISAFDSVLGSPIPDKGRVLTQISLFWFDYLKQIVPNHFLTESLDEFGFKPALKRHLTGRSMVVRKAKALPVECVVRGYLIGSGWKDYQKTGVVCGIKLPTGMKQAEKLPQPIFTPSTKAETGHDENISFEKAAETLGAEVARTVRDVSIKLYSVAADYARTKGIIIADTKFEFGLCDGKVILIDEALTPDSSRFWPADSYRVGISPPSYDKQFVRDWLENESGWNKEPPAPALPEQVIERTREKYVEAFERLAGKKLRRG